MSPSAALYSGAEKLVSYRLIGISHLQLLRVCFLKRASEMPHNSIGSRVAALYAISRKWGGCLHRKMRVTTFTIPVFLDVRAGA